MSCNNDPRRGCLADLITGCTLGEDGLYIGRSNSILGKARGCGNLWKVNDATLQSQEKGCRQLWEDDDFARWEMASVASPRSQVKSLLLPLV